MVRNVAGIIKMESLFLSKKSPKPLRNSNNFSKDGKSDKKGIDW